MANLYIHIPFCKQKCLYCDFYSCSYSQQVVNEYCDIIARQIELLDGTYNTVYLGGGTPSILDLKQMKRVLSAVRGKVSVDAEVTIECNPESVTRDKLLLFADYGVNRVTVGVQSFNDDCLSRLGRIHSSRRAKEVIELIQTEGFCNVGIDLIFGVWNQFFDDVMADALIASQLGVTHISMYSLSYEKGTPIYSQRANNEIQPLSDGEVADMYEGVVDILGKKGFLRYEVSNFARTGYESKHNLNYWDNGGYIGIGPAAVSYIHGVRSKNVESVFEYVKSVKMGGEIITDKEELTLRQRACETAALKIRTAQGIGFEWFSDVTGLDFFELEEDVLDELIVDGLLTYTEDEKGVKLTDRGFLFADTVSMAFL